MCGSSEADDPCTGDHHDAIPNDGRPSDSLFQSVRSLPVALSSAAFSRRPFGPAIRLSLGCANRRVGSSYRTIRKPERLSIKHLSFVLESSEAKQEAQCQQEGSDGQQLLPPVDGESVPDYLS